MALSEVWRGLPSDLTEIILSKLVDVHFYSDPAYTWTHLRHTSAHQKHVIEHRFRIFWLPKLGITLYAGVAHKFEYSVVDDDGDSDNESEVETSDPDSEFVGSRAMATFAVQVHIHHPIGRVRQESKPGKLTQKYLRESWDAYDSATHRNITVRLGERYLNGGCRGGYILNDTDLAGLQVLACGTIRFRWKDALSELLREEMYMRKVADEMFVDACNEWRTNNSQDEALATQLPPLTIQVKIWRCNIQFARRVAVLLHRAAKSQTSDRPIDLNFSAYSENLHKQQPDLESVQKIKNTSCCANCSRTQYPDIFEVVLTEESVVPRFEAFQHLLELHDQRQQQQQQAENENGNDTPRPDDYVLTVQTVLKLFRDEYAWTCEFHPTGEEEEREEQWEDLRSVWVASEEAHVKGVDVMQSLRLGDGRIRWELPPW
ncbi:hypothetical protein N658DRAFT_526912 [Parathielavia hyrcaniae]|uniref:Uncharacterized protein n=1 Tax=Parathielavia hyrcaniae TaxID=113614 RepID=A0AAN6SY35_9PEZI|nr:hypothetical protein N658DRAFT_526912 [Parathielavia hyrcaniae]